MKYKSKEDIKDQEHEVPDPPQWHYIHCKYCGKKDQKANVKYTRSCNKCRYHSTLFDEVKYETKWDTWGYTTW